MSEKDNDTLKYVSAAPGASVGYTGEKRETVDASVRLLSELLSLAEEDSEAPTPEDGGPL